jgi:N-acetylneuraminic acid mutarotase
MHRYSVYLILILSLVFGGLSVWAQETPPDSQPPDSPIIIENPPAELIAAGSEWQPIELEPANPLNFDTPFAIDAASDSCSTATELPIPGGDTTTITSFTQHADDPILSCMWGSPSSSTGYRTAWYKFTAPASGSVYIETFGSNYDTVLAIWKDISAESTLDPCLDFSADLLAVSCRDDSRGLSSETTISVRKNEVYYIEVADWEAAAPSTKSVRIAAYMLSFDSKWQLETSMPTALSRHATAVAGNNIYVIGGQKSQLGTVDIVNSLRRYNTSTDQWTTLQSMPGSGYSNTTAAFVDGPDDNGRIYLPSGYVGGAYDMTHWAYDIQDGYWLTRKSITDDLPTVQPFAWATAVADPSVNGYYVTGGLESTEPFSSTATVKNQMYLYIPNASGGSWLPRTDMGSPRYAHTAALVNGEVCVVGGISSGNVLLIDGECYSQGSGWSDIDDLNIPRYAATSAVGQDGRWYVIGGTDANGNAVAETEVYDMDSDTWSLLPVGYDLGGTASLPARAWPRGGTVGSTFWAIGGNNTEQYPLTFVESLFLPTDEVLLPVIMSNYGGENRLDDNFTEARQLSFNVPQYRNFDSSDDYYDVYYFDLTTITAVTVHLSQIPSNSNYDLLIYDDNKFLWGKGDSVFLGVTETVNLTLPAGRYYVMAERVEPVGAPNTADYRIVVER